jgi:ABC-type transporter MlaC component
MPKVFTEQFTSILESGYAYKIPELRLKKREVQGLPPLPKGNSVSIKTTLEKVHFPKQSQKEGE